MKSEDTVKVYPAEWYELYSKRARGSNNTPEARFELGSAEYLMLGDNSPRSQDSRVWPNARGATHRHAVPRSALVGRALLTCANDQTKGQFEIREAIAHEKPMILIRRFLMFVVR